MGRPKQKKLFPDMDFPWAAEVQELGDKHGEKVSEIGTLRKEAGELKKQMAAILKSNKRTKFDGENGLKIRIKASEDIEVSHKADGEGEA